MNKKNIYIILAVCCIIAILAIASLTRKAPAQTTKITFDNQAINLKIQQAVAQGKIVNIFFLIFLSLSYMFIFMVGVVHILLFLAKKSQKKSIIPINAAAEPLGLRPQDVARIFFAVTFSTLIIYIIGIYLHIVLGPDTQNARSMILNLTIQLTVIAVILKSIKIDKLRLNVKHLYLPRILQIYSVILPLVFLTAYLLKFTGIMPSVNAAAEIMLILKSRIIIAILILEIVLLAPIAEELLFRRIIYKALREKCSFFAAAGTTSLVFSLLHQNIGLTGPLFVVSMGLCYAYEKTQNVISAITLHALFNSMNVIILLTIKSLY